MDHQDIMLNEISQTEKDKCCIISFYVESKKQKPELIDTENRLVVVRGREWGMGEMGEGGQKVQTSSYKINKYWGCYVLQCDIVDNTVLYIWKLLRE